MFPAAYLLGHELHVVSLQGGEGDGAEGSDLGLCIFREDGNGLGEQRVLQSQQVHLNLGRLLCAVRAVQDQPLHLHHDLRGKRTAEGRQLMDPLRFHQISKEERFMCLTVT